MSKIRILLSCNTKAENYIDAMERLGVEVVAEYCPKVDTGFDGLIICGGSDIDPAIYGENIDGAVDIDHKRDEAEIALLKAYLELGKPIFGICRGHQLINAYMGGSLCQHLQSADIHTTCDGVDRIHEVTACADSAVGRIYGERFIVNSAHHQAVRTPGEGMGVTALWDGKFAEATEHCSLPILSVQWHPERICFGRGSKEAADGSLILKYFAELCRAYKDGTAE